MKAEIKSSEGLARVLEIEVDAATVDAAFSTAYKKYTKESKLKGFRPGKAPLNVIKTTYGEAIKEDVLEELVKNSYPEAIKEHELKVAAYPDVSGYALEEGKPLVYTAKVEVIPEIETIDYEGLTLPKTDAEVRDSEV
ncbi:MAG: trigger factor family protein, partial [candidate division Zixibacteria bacterium]|nr:trigger factor family protein [candidate division Zixibacteria bacterium]